MPSTPLQESCVTDTHAPNFAADLHRRAFGVAEHWLTALERVLVEHGLVKPDTPRASVVASGPAGSGAGAPACGPCGQRQQDCGTGQRDPAGSDT
jgi:hypothetical protein